MFLVFVPQCNPSANGTPFNLTDRIVSSILELLKKVFVSILFFTGVLHVHTAVRATNLGQTDGTATPFVGFCKHLIKQIRIVLGVSLVRL